MSYRHTDLPDDVLEKHQIGSVVEYEAFTSSSYSKEVFSGNHRLVITGKTGKRIEDLSYFNRSEREVLFTSPTKFFVTDRFRLDNGDTEIRLLEVDDD